MEALEQTASSAPPATHLPRRPDSTEQCEAKTPANAAGDFLASAPELVAGLRTLLQKLAGQTETKDRCDLLIDLCHRVRSFTQKAAEAALPPVGKLGSALENLLKKLFENPKNATASSLNTLSHALDLLQELCVPGLEPNLGSDPPPRMLVVDDDPLARRAIGYALQVAFGKPDSAANGQAALTLASQTSYEVVFADVKMPGLDGFTLCSKLHETAANTDTPVVFVTCHSDEASRSQAARCGGADFIAKPFLLSEITLKALTLILRRRLLFAAPAPDQSAPQPTQTPAGKPASTVPGPEVLLLAPQVSSMSEPGPARPSTAAIGSPGLPTAANPTASAASTGQALAASSPALLADRDHEAAPGWRDRGWR